jgi:hypothetical protein
MQEMPAVDALFTTVEGYQNMNIDYLSVRLLFLALFSPC